MTTKMTKRDFFNTVLSMDVPEAMRDFANAEIRALDRERENRAKVNSAKVNENKKLAKAVVERMEIGKSYLASELATAELTTNKISPLMRLATDMGLTTTGVVKTKNGYRNCYTRISVVATDEATDEAIETETETEVEVEVE